MDEGRELFGGGLQPVHYLCFTDQFACVLPDDVNSDDGAGIEADYLDKSCALEGLAFAA